MQNFVGSVMGKKCNGKKNVDMVIILSADRATCRMLVLADWPFVKDAGCIAGQLTGLFAFHFTSFITYLSFHIYPHVINSLRLPSLSSPLGDFSVIDLWTFCTTPLLTPVSFSVTAIAVYCSTPHKLVSYKHIYSRINSPNSPA